MNGFTTLAVGNGYLQRAAAFALSARRFGYPTILMHKDVDVSQYAPLFHQTVDVSRAPVVNDRRPCAIWELKKYCYALTEAFECCAFCDADSLVIKDPASVFTLSETVHTPGAKTLTAEMRWAVPPIIESTVELARHIGITQPIQTLNGGFLVWRRGRAAEEWFSSLGKLFEQIHAIYQRRGKHGVRDELCLALAFASRGIHLPKTDSSIGIWDAHNLVLSIENQEFECVKGYYWQGHRFRPCIAHFGGSRIGKRYRECVDFLTRRGEAELPLFLEDTTVSHPSSSLRDRARFNSYSVSKKEAEWLASFVREHGIKHVLEFGPGASSDL